MRSLFDRELENLNNSLIEMGALVENAISKATKALIEKNVEYAKEVISQDDIIDKKEKEIESLCLKLLLHQHPVARDLRTISTALKMITDMERIGDQAADISELCTYLCEGESVANMDNIVEMANATMKMVTESIDAFVKKDLTLAKNVIQNDEIVDNLYILVKKELIELVHKDINSGEQAFDLLQISKYYERIGDHAENIAEWVIFSITGQHKLYN